MTDFSAYFCCMICGKEFSLAIVIKDYIPTFDVVPPVSAIMFSFVGHQIVTLCEVPWYFILTPRGTFFNLYETHGISINCNINSVKPRAMR